jgi:PHD/YefM family antitoxin component YafN of YafNO toxin-antitoxin module
MNSTWEAAMAIEEMTTDEFKQNLDSLLNEEWFPPIGITRNGERRMVVIPADVFREIYRASRKVVHVSEMSEQDLKEIAESKMPEGYEHLDDELKED